MPRGLKRGAAARWRPGEKPAGSQAASSSRGAELVGLGVPAGEIAGEVVVENAGADLQSVLASRDPSRRAQYLADAQRGLGWAQRSAIEECQREKKLSWRQIGAVVSVAHDALYRQFASGGPVVTASPFYSKESRNNMMTITAQLAVAFRTVDDGRLHVLAEADVHGLDSFTMPFNPSNPSPYSGRDLQYYYRPAPGLALADLGRSAGYTMRPEGFGIAFCLTEGVMDELFGPPFIGSPQRRRWEADLEGRQRNARPAS